MDILSPAFLEMAKKAESLAKLKEEKVSAFKIQFAKHREEIDEIDRQAKALLEEYGAKLDEKKNTIKPKPILDFDKGSAT